jgi:hypothetical protein
MGLFDKLNKPVFLKEDSDAAQYVSRLKELQPKAVGEIKNRIDKEIKLASIGIAGENNIAFELKNSGMPMYIMHDIHFELDGLSAQIDYIVVTRKVTFIIECKNLIGNIEIDNNGNFIRNYELNGRYIKEGIYSPITQNQRHMEILKQIKREFRSNIISKMLFDKYFYDNYKSIVVLANPKTILNARYAKKEVKDMVIRADQLIRYIKEINEKADQFNLNDKELKDVAERLLSLHTPNKSDYAAKYEEIVSSIKNTDKNKTFEIHEDTDLAYKNEKEELIKELKVFRLQKSREEKIKPYFIFNDKQMMDLISKMPGSVEELVGVSGFGKIKAEKYGDMIIKILNNNR